MPPNVWDTHLRAATSKKAEPIRRRTPWLATAKPEVPIISHKKVHQLNKSKMAGNLSEMDEVEVKVL